MAPPLRRGRALVLQRLTGLVFLAVLAGLVGLSVASYRKAFTPWTDVVLRTDRVGNQLDAGADVKARGVLVGEVASVRATAEGAELRLRLQPEAARRVPASTRAQVLPKTLFGEKFVSLVFDGDGTAVDQPLTEGAVIAQDRSTTARELSAALDDLLPLLETLRPDDLSTTLGAISTALRGRGDRLGGSLVLARDSLAGLNPELDRLAAGNRGLADLADTLDAAAPDVLSLLDDAAAGGRSLVRDEPALDAFLRTTAGAARSTGSFVRENEQRLVALARESVPNLQLYERYSPQYPCLLDGIVRSSEQGEVFGGLQPGLHITIEVIRSLDGYVPGDEPEYLDDAGPTCFGLEGEPVRPFPTYRNPDDGFRDGQQVDPSTGRGDGGPPAGPGPGRTYPDQRRSAAPGSSAAHNRAVVGAAVAPVLGVTPAEVPDVAVLLLAPVTRGAVAPA
ncbi:MAG TPA: MCE family protein [Mycobacteriales bacterium]|nr:MCE family protein [Mycobacteriales bacterium]